MSETSTEQMMKDGKITHLERRIDQSMMFRLQLQSDRLEQRLMAR